MNVLYRKVKKKRLETRFLRPAYAETGHYSITLTHYSLIIGIDQPTENGGSYVR
jgi:hypothetical protein